MCIFKIIEWNQLKLCIFFLCNFLTVEISNSSTPSGESPDDDKNTSDNNSKIVIGAVSGVAMGIVLIVILVVWYGPFTSSKDGGTTPRPSGTYPCTPKLAWVKP